MLKSGLTYSILISAAVLLYGCKSDDKQQNASNAEVQKKLIVNTESNTSESKKELVVKAGEETVVPKQVKAEPIPKPKPPKKNTSQTSNSAKPTPVKPTPVKPIPKKTVVAKPAIQFETMSHDFGKLEEGDTYDYAFEFKNTGTAPLEITSASGSCGCAQPSFPFLEIPPGGTNKIGVHYNSVNKEGDQDPEIFVTTNIDDTKIKLVLTGTVIVTEERRKEKEAAIAKQKAAIAKAAEESRKRREAQEKITKARVDSILQAQKDTSKTIEPKG